MRFAAMLMAAASVFAVTAAHAQTKVKIGVLNDQSSLYADLGGQGSVWAAKKAVEDFNAAARACRWKSFSPITRTRPTWAPPSPVSGMTWTA